VTPAAFAADLYAPVVVPNTFTSSGFDWTGIYAGAVGGYVWGRGTSTITGGTPATVDPSGGQIGIVAGVNGQFDQFVLGLEGEVLWSGQTGNTTLASTNVATLKTEWQGALKARAGVAFDQVLVYAHGGVAFADVHASVATAGGAPVSNYRENRAGLTVGAGIEMAVTENVSLKAEYAYTHYGKWPATFNLAGGGTVTEDIEYHTHAIKAGVNFHF
jgi:outer membrane immunogenic protein